MSFRIVHILRALCLAVVLGWIFSQSAVIIDKEWEFASSRDVEFYIGDTLRVNVYFPDRIPDDRLIGYTRFGVTVCDSNAGSEIPNHQFIYSLSFDAGFLYFDHNLTFEMNYECNVFSDSFSVPSRFRCYLDPYPVTGLHQWYSLDAFYVDTVKKVMGFTYSHPKYIPYGKTNVSNAEYPACVAKTAKTRIASTGYPFEYGLFYSDGTAGSSPVVNNMDVAVALRILPGPGGGGLLISGVGIGAHAIGDYEVRLFSLNGKTVRQWRVRTESMVLPLEGIPSGRYVVGLSQGSHDRHWSVVTIVR